MASAEFIMAPQIPEGTCFHCQAPIIDLFAEWTEEYQSHQGRQAILAGTIVFDCYYCQGPLQLKLPLALTPPVKGPDQYRVAKRTRTRCEAWLQSQHAGASLSAFVEQVGFQCAGKWAFDGYNWAEGTVHRHGEAAPPAS
jgi:hypothetical protein